MNVITPEQAAAMQVPQHVPLVFKLISEITGELAKVGIAKDRRNSQQGYNFRGIDEVYNVLAPLLAKYKLVILPRVQERTVTVAKSNSDKALYFVALKVDYVFVAAEDGSSFIVQSYGEGMDSADKATNKAFSAAYKYAVIQAFAIPVEGTPDADAETPTEVAETTQEPAQRVVATPQTFGWTPELIAQYELAIKAARMSVKKTVKYFGVTELTALNADQVKTLDGFIAGKMQEQQGADAGKS